jgi:hypothetical protein
MVEEWVRERSDSAGEVNSIKTANAEQLRDEWELSFN